MKERSKREKPAAAQWRRALRALSDPTRYRMAAELAAAGELSCGEIGERFPLAQPTISHHIKILAEAGLLRVRRQGQHSLISLDRAVLRAALAGVGRELMTGAGPSAAMPRVPRRRTSSPTHSQKENDDGSMAI